MILERIEADADLSDIWLGKAIQKIPGGANELYVSTSAIHEGVSLARKFNLYLFVDDNLARDSWYVKGDYFGIFSPGA